VSNLGGMSAQIGKRQGEVGAIVEGGVRDIGHSRGVGYPIWSTDISPTTGKWRLEAAEINGAVVICGVKVSAGDLVVADDTGVCFIPRGSHRGRAGSRREEGRSLKRSAARRIDAGMPVPELGN